MFLIDKETGCRFITYEITRSIWIKKFKINKKVYSDVINNGLKCVYDGQELVIQSKKFKLKRC